MEVGLSQEDNETKLYDCRIIGLNEKCYLIQDRYKTREPSSSIVCTECSTRLFVEKIIAYYEGEEESSRW